MASAPMASASNPQRLGSRCLRWTELLSMLVEPVTDRTRDCVSRLAAMSSVDRSASMASVRSVRLKRNERISAMSAKALRISFSPVGNPSTQSDRDARTPPVRRQPAG